ncbi:SRP19-domain-containing protein [Cryphonectria parasitica EP155]|uniref:SRP19-domain-containing protein n=1 Tax=Cryphonectria parasitica (strain ATCC 38755 / EP155) TaxID=660469 RepID=A0A9P4Y3S4_CRYP1|nr:SRP19-domain-containing protein [Cryphonectria parasitica EP155]KAF3766096.1 SRP19-domain-containing protein [Cryphonectria parasitica EP155]
MSHARIEEVEDSDLEMSDPSEDDIDDFAETDILRSRSNKPQQPAPADARSHILDPSRIPSVSSGPPTAGAAGSYSIPTATSTKAYAGFQCLYPIYFDASRTRAEGRRVPKELAVSNPLAREIVNACRDLRVQTLFEPEKMHPRDWANPGRVKVQLKGDAGAAAGVKNKHQLYILVAQHLRNNPTTEKSAVLWERIPGGPPPPERSKGYPRPAVPRGWKMGDMLPYYSPAMTGGGVSENLFKDMMKEMQGGGGMPGLPGAGAGGSGNVSEDGAGKKKKGKGKGKA